MRILEELLPRTLLPRVFSDSAGGLQPLTGPDYLRMEEYNRPLTTTFFALGIILCTVLVLSLIICCAARLVGQVHERHKVRMRDRQRLTAGRGRVMRVLGVLRKGDGQGQKTRVRIGTAAVVGREDEEKGEGGKKDNFYDNDGCGDGNGWGKDLEKGGEEGEEEELPEYGAVGFNEKGEMIDAPCPAYLPRVKSVVRVSDDGYGGVLGKGVLGEKVPWRCWGGRKE